jgi:DNA-directed RNA polymerase specialized sigma24 family protein
MAEALSRRYFSREANADELTADAVSVAWEMAQNESNRERGHPGTIALFAVKRVACGRHHGESVRSIDAHVNGIRRSLRRGFFEQALPEGRRSSPATAAAFSLDFQAWLTTLTRRQREVALLLAEGHTMKEIATESQCTTNAVRMIRMQLCRSYKAFLRT